MVEKEDAKAIQDIVEGYASLQTIKRKLKAMYGGRWTSGGYAKVLIPENKNFVIKIILIDDDQAYTEYARYCRRYADKYDVLPKIYHSFKTFDYEVFIIEKLKPARGKAKVFNKVFTENGKKILVKRDHPNYYAFKKIANLVLKSYNQCFDIYDTNVMVRDNGTIVITDPVG